MRHRLLPFALLVTLLLLVFGGQATLAAVPGAVPAPADHRFWYLARAAGLSAYLLLTLDVVLGLAVRTRFFDDLIARWRSFDLHQFTALLALGFLALHLLALLGDHYIGFRPWQLLVPLASPYRPAQVALGGVALYLLLIVTGSYYVRRFIGQRAWRTLHYLTFGGWLLALGHGLFAGTDTGTTWGLLLYVGSGFIVTTLTIWRFQEAAAVPARPVPLRREARREGREVDQSGRLEESTG